MVTIATLIPAYKPDYLAPLFAGLQSQTFRDFRVIISDDSPDGVITRMIREGSFEVYLRGIDVIVIPGPRSPLRNHRRLIDYWNESTPLVHLHMDDDIIYPEFYREHVSLHDGGRISASVSLRWLTRPDGAPYASLPLPDFITGAQSRVVEIDERRLYESTVACAQNWLGELSNMVLSSRAAKAFPVPQKDGVSFFGLPDIGTILCAIPYGPVSVLRDHLSGFRQHFGQTTAAQSSVNIKIAHLAWTSFALHSWKVGYIDSWSAKRSILISTERAFAVYASDEDLREYFLMIGELADDLPALFRSFTDYWHRLLCSCPDTNPQAWN